MNLRKLTFDDKDYFVSDDGRVFSANLTLFILL